MRSIEGLERHLARSPGDADALLGLSGVVRDTRYGGPAARSLARLWPVLDALARRTGDRHVTVYAVADRSAREAAAEYADPREPRLLARWVRDGLVEEADDADGVLLDAAGATGLPVVGPYDRDEGDGTRFLHVVPADDGSVGLRAGPATRTRAQEEGGEAVCWLERVCPECGRLADAAPPTRCARCGTELSGG